MNEKTTDDGENKKTALITGASRGIGLATFCALAKTGAHVVGTATSDGGLQKIRAAIKENNFSGDALLFNAAADSDSADGMNSFLQKIAAQIGAPDIFVSNAGVAVDGLLMRMKEEDWEKVMRVNLGAFYRLCRAFVGAMIKKRDGRIIGVSSVVARSGNGGQANYCAAKAGMEGFIRAVAYEIGGRGVTINAVAPGFIDTDMTKKIPADWRQKLLDAVPLKRAGQPSEVADAIAFLASKKASYITGHTLHINGGMFMG